MAEEKITLTLTPNLEEEKAQEEIKEETPIEVQLTEETLTEEERQMVNEFSKQIDITSNSIILQYGAEAQKKIASFSESALQNVRTKDLGAVGDALSDLVVELKGFSADAATAGLYNLFAGCRIFDNILHLFIYHNTLRSYLQVVCMLFILQFMFILYFGMRCLFFSQTKKPLRRGA